MIPPAQAEAAALLRRLAGEAPIETHISAVFRGPETVWKLKKAVRLPYLDFSTVAARERFCRHEFALNALAAPGLYRDVVPVLRGADGAVRLGEPGGAAPEAIDWVLRMGRVPEADFLPAVLARGPPDPALLDALGDAVAAYHAQCPKVSGVDAPAALRLVAEGNALAATEAGLPAEAVRGWTRDVLRALAEREAWLAARAKAGFVRRAHGDLHLGNLCLWHGRPTLFDALEFDEALATIDTGYDLAFLLMDLDFQAGRAAANRVLNRYVARTGDADLVAGLPPFLSLRAMVRAHVRAGGVRAGGGAADAVRYLDLALACLRPVHPMVLAVGGLPGTGKSTLARAVAPALGPAPGALVLRSDEIRKRLHHAPPEQHLPPEAYGEAANRTVAAALIAAVRVAAAGGHTVIADATFLDAADRAAVAAAAASAGRPFLGVWLHAALPVLEARIARRTCDASDATVAVLRKAAAAEPAEPGWTRIDAGDRAVAEAALGRAVGNRLNL